jgi:hypothetical protein
MRAEGEIKKRLCLIGKERENIARKAVEHALLWVLEEASSPLIY